MWQLHFLKNKGKQAVDPFHTRSAIIEYRYAFMIVVKMNMHWLLNLPLFSIPSSQCNKNLMFHAKLSVPADTAQWGLQKICMVEALYLFQIKYDERKSPSYLK